MKGNGKGTVIGGGAAGQYSVKRLADSARIAAESAALTAKISNLTGTKIPQFEAELATAKTELNTRYSELNAAIAGGDQQVIKTATKAAREASSRVATAARALAGAKLQKTAAEKRLAFFANYQPQEPTEMIWCADYSESITGDVALIYPNGDPAKNPVIAPAAIVPAVWSAADGQRQGAIASTPSGAWFNRAIQPAAQRSLATYRLATVNALDTVLDTADVTLDAALGAQNINLNKTAALVAIPVEYMTCNASAFKVGDRVIVRFSNDQQNPTVIGFEDNPRPCSKVRFRKVVWVQFAPQSVIVGRIISHPLVSYAVREVRGTEIDVGVSSWDAPGSGAAGDWDGEILSMLNSQAGAIQGGRSIFLNTIPEAFKNFSDSYATKPELDQTRVERRSTWGRFTNPKGFQTMFSNESGWANTPGYGGYYSQPMMDFSTVDQLAGDIVWHETWASFTLCLPGAGPSFCHDPGDGGYYTYIDDGGFANEQRIMIIGVSFEKYETR